MCPILYDNIAHKVVLGEKTSSWKDILWQRNSLYHICVNFHSPQKKFGSNFERLHMGVD
jgi:hypothetical protein